VHARLRDWSKARDDLDAAITQHGATGSEYFFDLGRAHTNLGNQALAIATYDKLIDLQDKQKSPPRDERARALYARGFARTRLVEQERRRCATLIPPDRSCMEAGRFATALLDLQQALVYQPRDADAHFQIGWIAAEIGNYTKAIESYTETIKIRPNDSMAYSNRGRAYAQMREPELAFGDYNDAIRANPNNAYAWASRGTLQASLRRRQNAIEDLRKALSIDPNLDYAVKALRDMGVRP